MKLEARDQRFTELGLKSSLKRSDSQYDSIKVQRSAKDRPSQIAINQIGLKFADRRSFNEDPRCQAIIKAKDLLLYLKSEC